MIPRIVAALRAVKIPRLFETGARLPGQLLADLRAALPAPGLQREAIVEQE